MNNSFKINVQWTVLIVSSIVLLMTQAISAFAHAIELSHFSLRVLGIVRFSSLTIFTYTAINEMLVLIGLYFFGIKPKSIHLSTTIITYLALMVSTIYMIES